MPKANESDTDPAARARELRAELTKLEAENPRMLSRCPRCGTPSTADPAIRVSLAERTGFHCPQCDWNFEK